VNLGPASYLTSGQFHGVGRDIHTLIGMLYSVNKCNALLSFILFCCSCHVKQHHKILRFCL